MQPEDERIKIIRNAVMLGIFGNLVLTIFRGLVGIMASSIAVLADAVDSLSDMVVSIVVWFGLNESWKPPDKEHHYGHGDIEPLVGLFASLALVVMGYEVARFSFSKISQGVPPVPEAFALYATVLTIVFKEWMARYTFKVAEKTRSPAMKASAIHHRSDAYSSIIVIVGVAGALLGYPILDPAAGFIVSLFVLKLAVDVGRENTRKLIGTVPSPELRGEIEKIAEEIEGTKCVHNIRIHTVGAFANVDLHVCVEESLSINKAHEIASRVEEAVLKKLPDINHAVIHVEPYDGHHRAKYGKQNEKK